MHLSASPHDVRVAAKDAAPLFGAFNFQTTVPHPIPGNWQFLGAVGPGMIAVMVGVCLPIKFGADRNCQKVECSVICTVEPDLTVNDLPLLVSDIFKDVAALD